MRKYVFVFLLLTMLGASFALFSVNASSNKEIYKAGESGSITLVITNLADSGKIIGANVEVTGSLGFVYTENVLIGELSPGAVTTLTIPISVLPETKSGVYVFKMKAQGSEIANDGSLSTVFREVSIPVYVLNKPILLITAYNNDYSEGQQFQFTINNLGGAANNVRMKVLAPFALMGANEIYLGDITTSKNISVQLDVGDVIEGKNTVNFVFVYDDELGNELTETKEIKLTIKKETLDIGILQISNLTSNSDNIAKFKITNGAKALKNVKLTFTDPNIIIKEGSEIKLGDLASWESKEVEFTMHPNVIPGTMNEDVLVTYTDDGKEKTEHIILALTVGSNSDVQIYIEAKPVPLVYGQEHTLSVTVANTGDYPIESTSVMINGDFYDLVSVQNEQYIGLLNKDDFSSVQFKVKIKPDAKPVNTLVVQVKYKDAFGNIVEKEKKLSVKANAQPAEQSSPLPLIGGGVAVLGFVYWFFLRKKSSA